MRFFLFVFLFTSINIVSADEISKPFVAKGQYDVTSIDVTSDGKYVLSAGSKTIKIWDVKAGKELTTLRGC